MFIILTVIGFAVLLWLKSSKNYLGYFPGGESYNPEEKKCMWYDVTNNNYGKFDSSWNHLYWTLFFKRHFLRAWLQRVFTKETSVIKKSISSCVF